MSKLVFMRMVAALRICFIGLLLSSLAACQGPTLTQRIASNRAAFEGWSPQIQGAVSEGRIEVGFTPAQVRVAWGEPDDIAMEISAEAETERWIYLKKTPAIGIGFGVGNYGRSGGAGGSVGTTIGGDTNVVGIVRFKDGLVESFDRKK